MHNWSLRDLSVPDHATQQTSDPSVGKIGIEGKLLQTMKSLK